MRIFVPVEPATHKGASFELRYYPEGQSPEYLQQQFGFLTDVPPEARVVCADGVIWQEGVAQDVAPSAPPENKAVQTHRGNRRPRKTRTVKADGC